MVDKKKKACKKSKKSCKKTCSKKSGCSKKKVEERPESFTIVMNNQPLTLADRLRTIKDKVFSTFWS